MTWLRVLIARLTGLFRKRRLEAELNEEVRLHLEMLVEENLRKGMTSQEARTAALRSFGGVEQVKEAYREQWALRMIETFIQDVRYGARQLRRSPGFTAVAVLTLALGIGANTAIFSVINAVMLRMLPVESPEQLVQVGFQGKHSGESFIGESFSYPLFKELRRQNQVFTDIAAFDYWNSLDARPANAGSTNERVKAQMVSVNFFSMLGLRAVIGRTFATDEDNGVG